MEFNAFDKILALPENRGAKIKDYGIDERGQVLILITNGKKYLADFDSNFQETKTDHYYERSSWIEKGYKCLYKGVVPPRRVTVNILKW